MGSLDEMERKFVDGGGGGDDDDCGCRKEECRKKEPMYSCVHVLL